MCWGTMWSGRNGGKRMTDAEKKLLQAKHRMEEAQARDRVKERKARTRRLDSGRCDFGKGDARGAGDGVVRPRNLSLAEAVTILFCTLESLRGTGGFPFFVPEGGALTHHLLKQAVAALPLAGHVRSPRGIAAPAGAAGQGCISAKLPALPMQSAQGFPLWKSPVHGVVYCHLIPPPACVKPATGSLTQIQEWNKSFRPAGGTSHFTMYQL